LFHKSNAIRAARYLYAAFRWRKAVQLSKTEINHRDGDTLTKGILTKREISARFLKILPTRLSHRINFVAADAAEEQEIHPS